MNHEPLIQSWVNQLESPDEKVRLKATQALGLRPESAVLLIPRLGDDSWQIRQAAVAGLAQWSDPAIAPRLLDLLRQQHHNPGVVESVLRILALSAWDGTSLLLECARDVNADLRIYAMTALGEQRNPRAFTTLMQGLSDVDMNVRYHAIESLGRQGNVAAVEALLAIAVAQDPFLAFPALNALGKIGDRGVVPRLLPLLNDDLLGLPTIETLGSLGEITAIPFLAQTLDQPHAPVAAVASAIAQIYHTALSGGMTQLALPEFLQRHMAITTAEKLIPMVTQLKPLSATPNSRGGINLDSVSDSAHDHGGDS